MYVEDLITILEKDGRGCWIDNQFHGIMIYVDDMLLLSPSLTGLQSMLDRCKQFGFWYGLSFTAKKTACVEFHNSAKYPVLAQYGVLMGTKVHWVNRLKYLGHTFDCCANQDADIRSRSNFTACVSNTLNNFAFAHPQTKIKMCNRKYKDYVYRKMLVQEYLKK